MLQVKRPLGARLDEEIPKDDPVGDDPLLSSFNQDRVVHDLEFFCCILALRGFLFDGRKCSYVGVWTQHQLGWLLARGSLVQLLQVRHFPKFFFAAHRTPALLLRRRAFLVNLPGTYMGAYTGLKVWPYAYVYRQVLAGVTGLILLGARSDQPEYDKIENRKGIQFTV